MKRRASGSGLMGVTGISRSGRRTTSSQITHTMRTVFKSTGKTLMAGMIKTAKVSTNLSATKEYVKMALSPPPQTTTTTTTTTTQAATRTQFWRWL